MNIVQSSNTSGRRTLPAFALFVTLLLLVVSTPLPAQSTDVNAERDDLFLFKPNTPSRQVRGALLAEKLERPTLAQGYLKDLLESQPSTDVLLALRSEFGIGTFLKLSATRELQPTARELLKLINEASTQIAPSASTVELLIAELGQSKQQTKEAALRILSAEGDAVAPLMQADRNTPQGAIADELLTRHARRFRDGLLNALRDADDSRKTRILNLLATTADPQLVSDLLVYRFDQSDIVAESANTAINRLSQGTQNITSAEETADVLMSEAMDLIRNAGTAFPTIDDRLNDRNLQQRYLRKAAEHPFGAASLARATRLMHDAATINPKSQAVAAGLIVAEVTEQSWMAKWPDKIDLPTAAKTHLVDGKDVLAMKLAIETENPASSLALLTNTAKAATAFRENPQVLRTYLLSSAPRTRLLAAAIATSEGIGGNLAKGTLSAAISGSDKPEAVVIDSRPEERSSGEAVLDILKYSTAAAGTGQLGFELATRQMHCELIVIHSNCLRWSLSDTIANLRTDFRTRNTPIIIFGPERDRYATSMLITRTKGVWFVPQPLSEITFRDHLQIDRIPAPVLGNDERRNMVEFAQSIR